MVLNRYLQAAEYRGYGMDCNACAIMYFLQSYGFIPPNTSRREFEHLFTPLVTKLKIHLSWEGHEVEKKNKDGKIVKVNVKGAKYRTKNRTIPVTIDGKTLKPKPEGQDLITNTDFLRGTTGYGIMPKVGHTVKGDYTTLYGVCQNFYNYKDANGNKTLQKFQKLRQEGCDELISNGVDNIYDDLRTGLNGNYFERHVVFVGIYLKETGNHPSHYCVIVNEPREYTITTDEEIEVKFWAYPADDPMMMKTEVHVLKSGEDQKLAQALLLGKNEDGIPGITFARFQNKYIYSYESKPSKPDAYLEANGMSLRYVVPQKTIEDRAIVSENAFGVKPNPGTDFIK